MQTTRTPLTTGWRVRELETRDRFTTHVDWIPAQVPGHIHLDLLRAGVLADPFWRMHERACAWVDETDWVYETTFQTEAPPAHAYLVFHGLDTVAEILLNGEEIGRAANMFIPHEFPVGGRLKAGENTLRVVFRSALRVGRERQKAWEEAGKPTMPPHWFTWGPRSFVRKAQYMYGWDWGPELVSCGIWRPVELVTVPVARLLDWKYDVELSGGTPASPERAVVTITAQVERAPEQEQTPLTLRVTLASVRTETGDFEDPLPPPVSAAVPNGEGRCTVTLSISIERPRLWWPNGSNPEGPKAHPALYTMELSLHAENRLDERRARVGLRTIELIREPDADGKGESFKFRVNGEDIFMKGANWIPADSFPSQPESEARHTPAWDCPSNGIDGRIARLIMDACDAGFNMLRVWGGGFYESEHFYDLCDEHGILVWQDFPYGCAYYPDTGEYAEAARKEAIAAVRRVRHHPSLALWCGNNENQMFYHHWQGRENAPPFLGERLYNHLLPAVVQDEDPKTPYWPGSPYGGDDPNGPDAGDCHNWDVWHGRGDWKHYPENDARFLSEFGFSSSCGLTAWNSCLAESDRWPRSLVVRWHDKTKRGYETYLDYIRLHFPEPQTLEDLVYYSQLNQAEALKCGVEHWRRRKGRCWGTLFWQINDCWPVQSWAVIDYTLEPKAAYYAAKRFYAPVLLSLTRREGSVEAHLTNDLREHIQGEVTLTVETFDGDVLLETREDAYIGANETGLVAALDVSPVHVHASDVYVYARFEPFWEVGQGRIDNFLFLAEPKDLRLPEPGLRVRVEDRSQNGREKMDLILSAKRFAPYVWLRLAGRTRLSAHPHDDNFFHLRAGEERRLLIGRDEVIRSPEDVWGRLKIRSL